MEKPALHDTLCGVLGVPIDDKAPCYFEPPNGFEMSYPCFVYHHTNDRDQYADNKIYKSSKRYTVTIIDEDPDSQLSEKLKAAIPYCSLDRKFSTDGLSHWVHVIYWDGPRFINKEEKEDE